MIHLMKLELIKIKIGKPIRQAILTNLIILGLCIGMCVVSVYGTDPDEAIMSFQEAMIMTSVLAWAAFLIFSSVIMNQLTVSEYKNRTIVQLFTYPIHRKKLFVAKLMIVFVFTTLATACSSIFNSIVLYGVCKVGHFFADTTVSICLDYLPECLIGAIMCGFISLVPFYFGMRKKSGAATIISSVIIVVLLCNSMGSISKPDYMLRLLIAGGISILSAVYTICVKLNQLESSDL